MGSQKFERSVCRALVALSVLTGAALLASPALADVTRPQTVSGVAVDVSGNDVALSWNLVSIDAAGQPETVDHYRIYRGTTPDFVPDRLGGSNRIGTSPTPDFTDPGAAASVDDFYYLISAVDSAGNEGNLGSPSVTAPPSISSFYTIFNVTVDWAPSDPDDDVVAYRVYRGEAPGVYDAVTDVGLANSHTLFGLQNYVQYFMAVTAVDAAGNESPFSDETVNAVAGIVRTRAHETDELCWGASQCTPVDPNKIQRNNGFQLLAPVDFPVGDEWTSITATLTVESRLCQPPAQGTVTRCGPGNDCPEPPCNGGYNPCGDPWDRTIQMWMVLDNCIADGGSCLTPLNLELIHAVTPFGTDADPPDGRGIVPPREYTIDVTPFASLFTGTQYIGVEIVHFVQKGWWVTVEFEFSDRADNASPKPPADGVQVLGYGNAPLPVRQFSVPAGATEVKARVFTSGHGGSLFCDGGSNDAQSCSSSADCPGGVCNPCDEFCTRLNRLKIDGNPVWEVTPWRTDCSPGGNHCSNWNSCGVPSCTFSRAGWCPGYMACHKNPPCDQDIDLTPFLPPPGGTYDFDYDVMPQTGSWPTSVVLYWYE